MLRIRARPMNFCIREQKEGEEGCPDTAKEWQWVTVGAD